MKPRRTYAQIEASLLNSMKEAEYRSEPWASPLADSSSRETQKALTRMLKDGRIRVGDDLRWPVTPYVTTDAGIRWLLKHVLLAKVAL